MRAALIFYGPPDRAASRPSKTGPTRRRLVDASRFQAPAGSGNAVPNSPKRKRRQPVTDGHASLSPHSGGELGPVNGAFAHADTRVTECPCRVRISQNDPLRPKGFKAVCPLCPHCPHKKGQKRGPCPAANPCVPMGLGDFCHFARKIGQKSPNRISRGDTRPTSWSVWSAQPTPPELPQRAPGTSLQLCPLRQAQPVPAGCLLRFGNVPPARSLRLVLPAAKLLFLLPITDRPLIPAGSAGDSSFPRRSREKGTAAEPPGEDLWKAMGKTFQRPKISQSFTLQWITAFEQIFQKFFKLIKPAGYFPALYTRRAGEESRLGKEGTPNRKRPAGKREPWKQKVKKGLANREQKE